MFTRVIELTAQSGKSKHLCDTIDEKIVPILRKQPGFVDEMVLVSTDEPDRILSISLWNSQSDAEHYHRDQYPKIYEMVRALSAAEPVIRTYDVRTSTGHHIATGKAA